MRTVTKTALRGISILLLFSGFPRVCAQVDFAARRDLAVGYSSETLASDFDRDHRVDLVELTPDALYFRKGRGNGTFDPPIPLPLDGTWLWQLDARPVARLADMNNDGWPDIVAQGYQLGQEGRTILIFLAIGPPDFFAPPIASRFPTSGLLQVGDVNEDGNLDVMVTPSQRCPFYLLLGDGAGNLHLAAEVLPGGVHSQLFLLADFDGDGHLDLWNSLREEQETRLEVRFGRGDGTFDDSLFSVPRTSTFFRDAKAADLDLDGRADVVLSTGEGTLIQFGGVSGFHEPILIPSQEGEMTTGDLDRDGYPDLVTGGDLIYTIRQDRTGAYHAVRHPDPVSPHSFKRLADLNGDGWMDLISSGIGNVSILLNNGSGDFESSARSYPLPVAIENSQAALTFAPPGDWNEDGLPDVVASVWMNPPLGGIWLFSNLGDGSFSEPVQIASFGANALAAGHYNDDSHLDLVTSGHRNIFLFGTGRGSFTVGPEYSGVDSGRWIERCDLNRDGRDDLVQCIPSRNQVRLYVAREGGLRLHHTIHDEVDRTRIADVDMDGFFDVVAERSAYGRGGNAIYFGDPLGTSFEALEIEDSFPGFNLADFDGDGLLDVALFQSRPAKSMTVLRNVDGRSFEVFFREPQDFLGTDLTSFDADGDGDLDLAWCYGPSLRTRKGLGDGTFESQVSAFGLPGYTGSLAIADYDQDLRLDVAVPTKCCGEFRLGVLLNRTAGHPGALDLCLQGAVHRGLGNASDVLFVNGSSGRGNGRRISLGLDDPLTIRMNQPPSRARRLQSAFSLYLWRRVANDEQVVSLPFANGTLAFHIRGTGNQRLPKRTWNNLRHYPILGSPDFESDPAPSEVLNLSNGVGRAIRFTIQGVIRDDGAAGRYGVSTTNGIIVEVQ